MSNGRIAGWSAVVLLSVLVIVLAWPRPPAIAPDPSPDTEAGKVTAIDCPLPPPVASGQAPLQTDAPHGMPAFAHPAAALAPLAGFSVDARILSRRDYRLDREADLSPTDLALGWGRMREDAVLDHLQIGQSRRWYHYRWSDPEPPLPPMEIMHSSANMHMIPGDAGIARALARLQAGQDVRIHGWLVEARAEDGWRWRSSLRRDDTGQGACEVVYVCAISVR